MVTHSSTDIVERLRDRDALAMSGLYYAIPAMIDAALEIERLRDSLTTASGEAVTARTTKSGILTLDVEGWTLSVRTHDGGYEVSITEDGKCPASHYVRLDHEQADTLRDFMVETSPAIPSAAQATAATPSTVPICCYCDADLSCARCGREQPAGTK